MSQWCSGSVLAQFRFRLKVLILTQLLLELLLSQCDTWICFHVYLTRLAGWELLDCYLPTPPWSPKVTWVQSSTIIIWFSASWSYIIKSVKWDLVHLCHYWAFSRPMTPVASDRWTISGISKTTENKTCSGSYMHFMWLQLWINKGRWSRERVWVHYKSSPQQDKSCVHFNNKPFFFFYQKGRF